MNCMYIHEDVSLQNGLLLKIKKKLICSCLSKWLFKFTLRTLFLLIVPDTSLSETLYQAAAAASESSNFPWNNDILRRLLAQPAPGLAHKGSWHVL
ncbi:hypothetical protein AOLI_G00083750 [Acnodon oligacanthus]